MSDEIDKLTGLPKELFDLDEISKESQKIKIRVFRRAFGKLVTLVSGFESAEQAKELCKILKKKLACGGTMRDKEIELQGEHIQKAKEVLVSRGFKGELIDAEI